MKHTLIVPITSVEFGPRYLWIRSRQEFEHIRPGLSVDECTVVDLLLLHRTEPVMLVKYAGVEGLKMLLAELHQTVISASTIFPTPGISQDQWRPILEALVDLNLQSVLNLSMFVAGGVFCKT